MANNNNFRLTLDTLAPTGSISRGDTLYINANKSLVIDKGDATLMKVWFNSTASGTKSDPEYPSNPIAAATSYTTTFSVDGSYYYHMTLIDSVNNESSTVFNTAQIIFDTTRPTISNAQMADPDTGSTTVTNNLTGVEYSFNYSDGSGVGASGVNHVTITGDDINTLSYDLDPTKTSESGTFDFKSGTQDGQKTINIVVTDRAGNTSLSTSVSILLDTVIGTPTLALETTSGSSLPPYINYAGIKAHLTSTDTDIVGYKIWEGSTEPSAWDTTGLVTGDPVDVLVSKTLSGDGTHTFHAKVKDSAGTIVSATDVSVVYDGTAPTGVSVTSNKSIISNQTGFDTATLTLAADASVSGLASYTLKCGDTTISSGNSMPSTFSLTSANSMAEGANTITLIVQDRAGNSAQNTCTVTLDTTAPVVSIGSLATWYNAHFNISIDITEANTPTGMWVWTNTSSTSTTVPAGAKTLSATTGVQTVVATDISWADTQDAHNYVHVKVIDSVGNAGYAHSVFGYDSVAPDAPTVNFSQSAYLSTTASINISYTPGDTSGIAYMRVTGDITDGTPNNQWESFVTPRTVTLTTGDGTKNVYVQLKDTAGNTSSNSQAASCELDTSMPTITIELYNAENTAVKPSVSPDAAFTARVTVTDQDVSTDPNPTTYYHIWGDYTTGGSGEPSDWINFTPDSGQTYESITGLSCTSGDGPKQIKVRAKDSAGNQTAIVIATFTYDTTDPEVEITTVDHNSVSKVHIERRFGLEVLTGQYADECNFTFTPDEHIQAWKVCAYADETAAAAGSHNDPAIPSTNKSSNMTGNGGNANTAISCKIKGADYETALGGTGHDGAHIVVVYVQDDAGRWSAAAVFSN